MCIRDRDITPPIGTPRGGAYATIPSVGVLDPLHAKAIVVEQDGAKAAFVSVGGKGEAELDVEELKDKDGVLEVQGDHCERVLAWLSALGYTAKRAGG